ncbi:uncharacterized protein HKW66_Vig0239760 [Vigna angularis]|uniref:Uncharacterized protein n=1 Tax=Phaseolus angularis TaxID=3914 RepID=A0A8T0JHV4_PHAAN|nr:uncharacterized protein HKW66_Vig0239760 [Vigna angularis]
MDVKVSTVNCCKELTAAGLKIWVFSFLFDAQSTSSSSFHQRRKSNLRERMTVSSISKNLQSPP